MKPCILVLLLGFDEIESVRKRYSVPNAICRTYMLPSLGGTLSSPLLHPEDQVTVMEVPPNSPVLPKYQTCILLSLVEPLVDAQYQSSHPHYAAFLRVRRILESIPNWSQNFKIIVKYHDVGTDSAIRFDTRLLRNAFIRNRSFDSDGNSMFLPDTFTEGFQEGRTFDLRRPENPLTLEETKRISREIAPRTYDIGIAFECLVRWIQQCLPLPPLPFNEQNPLRITLGGCYAGLQEYQTTPPERDVSNLEKFALIFSAFFPISFVEIIGAVTWTFFDDWRAASIFPTFLMQESNPDPLRDALRPGERDFSVKSNDISRRDMTRVVYIRPPLAVGMPPTITYQARPRKGDNPYTPLLYPWAERIKTEIMNVILEIFKQTNQGYYMRVPEYIKIRLQDINASFVKAYTIRELQQATQDSIRIAEMPPPPNLTQPELTFHINFFQSIRNKLLGLVEGLLFMLAQEH